MIESVIGSAVPGIKLARYVEVYCTRNTVQSYCDLSAFVSLSIRGVTVYWYNIHLIAI